MASNTRRITRFFDISTSGLSLPVRVRSNVTRQGRSMAYVNRRSCHVSAVCRGALHSPSGGSSDFSQVPAGAALRDNCENPCPLTNTDCFDTLGGAGSRVEGSASVETIGCAEPLRGGWGYGDSRARWLKRQGWPTEITQSERVGRNGKRLAWGTGARREGWRMAPGDIGTDGCTVRVGRGH